MRKYKMIFTVIVAIVIIGLFENNVDASNNKPTNASINGDPSVFINEVKVRFVTPSNDGLPPISYKDNIYIPIRSFGNYLGYKANWNGETNTVSFEQGSKLKGMILPINDYVHYFSYKSIFVEENSNINFEIDGQKFVPIDYKGNKVNAICYMGHTFLPYTCLGKMFDIEVSYSDYHEAIIFGNQIEDNKKTDIKYDTFSKIQNKEDLLLQLNRYPFDNKYSPFNETVLEENNSLKENAYEALTNGDFVETRMANIYDSIPQYMNGFFTRDYRTINEDKFKSDYMPYFKGWWTYKNEDFDQESFVKEWINDTKKYNIVQISNFVTDKRLLYTAEGSYVMRGRWQFKYESHTNPSNIKFEIENDTPIEIGQWYEVDMDVMLYSPLSNAPTKVKCKMEEIIGPYIFTQAIENYKYLSDFRKINEEDVINFNNYKKVVNRSMNRIKICSYEDWIYYYDCESNKLCKIKEDGTESAIVYSSISDYDKVNDRLSNKAKSTFHVYNNAIYIYNEKDECLDRLDLRDNNVSTVMNKCLDRFFGIEGIIYYQSNKFNIDNIEHDLYKINLDDLSEEEVTKNIDSCHYLFDDKYIYYKESDTKNLMKYNIYTGEKELLTNNVIFLETLFNDWVYYNNNRISTDGTRIQTKYDAYQWVDIKFD